jgi:molybdopterin/thiamine biosynthesis adenylyltransferase
MRQANVLLIGFDGTGAEIAKNLVLAGIGSLHILDTKKVEMSDLSSNFFLTEQDIGRSVCVFEFFIHLQALYISEF